MRGVTDAWLCRPSAAGDVFISESQGDPLMLISGEEAGAAWNGGPVLGLAPSGDGGGGVRGGAGVLGHVAAVGVSLI